MRTPSLLLLLPPVLPRGDASSVVVLLLPILPREVKVGRASRMVMPLVVVVVALHFLLCCPALNPLRVLRSGNPSSTRLGPPSRRGCRTS
jgi:hypothetical protein